MLAFFRTLRPIDAVWICGILYLAVTATGLFQDGYNPDDWRQLAGAPAGGMPLNWTTEEGRWAMELIFVYLFAERFMTPLMILLAFPCLMWSAHLLARGAADTALRPVAMALIFVIGTNHIYMTNALNFSSHVFAYPFALALSATAFWLIDARTGLWWRIPLALQALALSAGIYQPFALFGAALPLLALMRPDTRGHASAFGYLILGAVIGIAGLGLYVVEWKIAAALHSHVAESERFGAPDLASTLSKLKGLPDLWRQMATTSLQLVPGPLRAFNGLATAGIVSAVAVAAMVSLLQGGGIGRVLGFLRIAAAGFAILFILPVLTWFTFAETGLPERTFGYLGFLQAAVLLAALAQIAQGPLLPRTGQVVGLGLLAAMGTVNLFVASAIWGDQARTGARDRELARAIYTRVTALPGYDGGPIRIEGGLNYDQFSWGGMLGWTVFHTGNPVPSVFREMFGVPWVAEFLAASPKACPAFPAHDAVYLFEGQAHVCLTPFAQDLLPLDNCQPVAGRAIEGVCVDRGLVALLRRDCAAPLTLTDSVDVLLDPPSGGRVSFTVDARLFSIAGQCYQIWPHRGPQPSEITITETVDGAVALQETLPLVAD